MRDKSNLSFGENCFGARSGGDSISDSDSEDVGSIPTGTTLKTPNLDLTKAFHSKIMLINDTLQE